MGKIVDKNISKNLSGKFDLIDNKIPDKVTKVLTTSPRGNSETDTNEEGNIRLDRDIPRERYISPEKILLMI